MYVFFFFFQAEDGIRDYKVTGVQTCALPILQKSGLEFNLIVLTLFWATTRDHTIMLISSVHIRMYIYTLNLSAYMFICDKKLYYTHTYILFVICQKWVDHRRRDTDINTSHLLLILLLLQCAVIPQYLLLLLISSVYLQSLERLVFVFLHITGRIHVGGPVSFCNIFWHICGYKPTSCTYSCYIYITLIGESMFVCFLHAQQTIVAL